MRLTPSEKIAVLFNKWSGRKPDHIAQLPGSGSSRIYYRIYQGTDTYLAAFNANRLENKAFLYFSRHFKKHGLNVPEILAENPDEHIYLLEDLGDETLFSLILKAKNQQPYPPDVIRLMQVSLSNLIEFQVDASGSIDYSYCYPIENFNKQAILWDLNYFKYYFLRSEITDFDEQGLEDDFHSLANFLLSADREYFMYRDFQSRNIMVTDGIPYFIDYQGGRKGALQYDVASFIWQAKAELPFDLRNQLLDFYILKLQDKIKFDHEAFKNAYYGYVLIRTLQVLGAYGFRGLFEKKPHFLESIPYAIRNLAWWLDNIILNVKMPVLLKLLRTMTNAHNINIIEQETISDKLTVFINSFSYKKGIPEDITGHGEGFVFDCRALPNPGRLKEFRNLSGRDQMVIDYIENHSAVDDFLSNAFSIVQNSVDEYIKRGFLFLTVNFGCTGGQHRSVYCAEKMADFLNKKYDIHVSLTHKEKQNWVLNS